ncbi:helix-turn-helix transcriptional regulator [Pedobacter cryoconitis]|uniref:AraC-like DNA-binding protein n=1 Tax=Pedobacter cryoconitis TaxID=188932 RepID=A0A327RVW3_9SPHI|nr:AraC family transcriptional regulator [Pedobacter cryoconitis]RAJ20581.1 AraC-like DNA-binding protein [Pedobacter cryoconitis]
MNLERTEFLYNFTITPEWQQQIVDKLGATLIDNKILIMPEAIATGGSIFLEVLPGLSVLLMDMTFHIPLAITRIPTKQNYYMAYFDIGDEITTHLLGEVAHKAGYNAKLGLGFMDCCIKGILMPPVGERSYSLRLFIDKDFFVEMAIATRVNAINTSIFDESKNTLFFYSHIDSRSKVMLNNLKCNDFTEPAFELNLKSTALYLLGYLMERTSQFEPIISKLVQKDIDSILRTSEYMLNNLLFEFPGLIKMAGLAEMSVSKYKILFKKILKESPNSFFLNEKLLLAQKLLESGNFNSVNEVAYELGYTKPSYFAAVYKKMFGALPGHTLIKSELRDLC